MNEAKPRAFHVLRQLTERFVTATVLMRCISKFGNAAVLGDAPSSGYCCPQGSLTGRRGERWK